MFRQVLRFLQMIVILVVAFFGVRLFAQNPESNNFQMENGGFMIEGGMSSSNSFQYFSNTGQFVLGESSAGDFIDRLGFLFFPVATSAVVTATPGDTNVDLNWTAAVGTLGNITSYDVGMSTTAGGVYVYTTAGDVLTYTKTGLTNNIPYYFKVRAYASGILLSESSAVTATPVSATPPGGGGGGGGGGTSGSSVPNIIAFGKAYPASRVTILRDGQVAANTVAGSDASFSVGLSGLAPGNYSIGAYATDANGIRSTLQTFPVTVSDGVTVNVGSIFIAPTITADKVQVKQGDDITFFGQTTPSSQVTISVHSAQEFFSQTNTDASGVYLNTFDSSRLEMGSHAAKSKAVVSSQVSSYGSPYNFTVGNENILSGDKKCPTKADLNSDCRVNLVDFSIAAFWYKQILSAAATGFEKAKLNGDGKINLVDFSIMAFYWTG